ncbi:MAG: hypothetical protein FJ028_00455 [Chloroflexi bacterium]|nr:hypothetical protein [Chloroflexota bacterium]
MQGGRSVCLEGGLHAKSRLLFERMIGRGTRKGLRHPDKSHFVVFDRFDGTLLEYFRSTTGVTAEPPESDGKTIVGHPPQRTDRGLPHGKGSRGALAPHPE